MSPCERPCPYCDDATRIVKNGHSSSGVQLYWCRACGGKFQRSYAANNLMWCRACGRISGQRNGRRPGGGQRYRCKICRAHWQDTYVRRYPARRANSRRST